MEPEQIEHTGLGAHLDLRFVVEKFYFKAWSLGLLTLLLSTEFDVVNA